MRRKGTSCRLAGTEAGWLVEWVRSLTGGNGSHVMWGAGPGELGGSCVCGAEGQRLEGQNGLDDMSTYSCSETPGV